MRHLCTFALLELLLAIGAVAQAPDVSSLLQKAEAIEPWLIDVRRRLHQVPELLYDLPATTALVTQELADMGISYK